MFAFCPPILADSTGFAAEVDTGDPHTLVDGRAEALGVLEQDQVELRPVDVERVITVDAVLVPLVEQDLRGAEVVRRAAVPERVDVPALRRRPRGTVLLGKTGFLDGLHRAGLQQHRGGRRHQ
jgi:hypothetical protein